MSPSLPSFSFPAGADRRGGVAAARTPSVDEAAPDRARRVEAAIADAARQTGVDFAYLLAQARVESALDPAAKARNSSASGLYQFIESTWLETMQRHGARFGLGGVVDAIAVDADGVAHVADPGQRAAILALRHDPQIAAWMAAGLAEDNAAHLTPILGRAPDHGELYLAHFLGAGGAGRFLSAMQDNPHQRAADLFARAAVANRPVFYDTDGTARSLAGVMHHLTARMERAGGIAVRAGNQNTFVPGLSPARSAFGGGAASPPGEMARAMPLSAVLSATFGIGSGAGDASSPAQVQVRRAYAQLRAFRL